MAAPPPAGNSSIHLPCTLSLFRNASCPPKPTLLEHLPLIDSETRRDKHCGSAHHLFMLLSALLNCISGTAQFRLSHSLCLPSTSLDLEYFCHVPILCRHKLFGHEPTLHSTFSLECHFLCLRSCIVEYLLVNIPYKD